MSASIDLKRLLYRSWYRGCKETDQLVGSFARECLPGMDDAQQALFARLMEEDDENIWKWATGALPAPEQYRTLLATIVEYRQRQAP